MARLDIFRTPKALGTSYLLDVQSNVLSHLRTRVVVSLLPAEENPQAARDINPVMQIGEVPHVLLPQAIASIPARELRSKVGSVLDERDIVLRARHSPCRSLTAT